MGFWAAHQCVRLHAGTLTQLAVGIPCFYAVLFIGNGLCLRLWPFPDELVLTPSTHFAFYTYSLFWLFVFLPVLRSFFLPPGVRRLLYRFLGTPMGKNTYPIGIVLDPPLVEFGDNVAIGFESVFSAHAFEGQRFVLGRIRVGNRATIGARAMIMPGVTIEEDAIVAAGAIVSKGTRVGRKEVWGGIPARKLKTLP